MKKNGFVVLLTVLITGLCLFELSFTFRARQLDDQARAYAMDETGAVNWRKMQEYRDSLWNEPAYFSYTYKEVIERRINLGLDLQGGMHVTLEVSPIDILRALAGKNPPPAFEEAIAKAKQAQKTSGERFTNLFFAAFEEVAPNTPLSEVFATAANKGRISVGSSNEEVQDVIRKEVEAAIDRAEEIIKTRIDKFGVSQPNIQRIQGTGRIQIELPGVDNPARVRKLLQGVAQLEFLEVYTTQEYDPILGRLNEVLLKKEKAERALAEGGKPEGTQEGTNTTNNVDAELGLTDSTQAKQDSTALDEPQASSFFMMVRGFQPSLLFEAADTAKVNDILARPDVQAILPSNMRPAWNVKPFMGGDNVEYVYLYFLKTGRGGEAPLTGEVIIDARQSYDELGNPDVAMQMNADGARKWQKLTGKNVNRQVAIVLDNYVYSAPNVREEIAGGRSSISGGFSLEEAQDLANILKAGKLPAPTRIVEEAVVGPTLGMKAQTAGIFSIIAGLGIVVVFMVAYYAKGGWIANLALLFNIFFIVGILAQLHAALTLPGIAGIVLTMGMSIDANVLVFERIREELKVDATNLTRAIELGYDRAFWTIFDANVTTALTGVFLYAFGSGPVKGFAVTLLIGIACSFFSAVFITREVIARFSGSGTTAMSFQTPLSAKLFDGLQAQFIAKRKMAYAFSAAVIVIGWGLIAVQGGLNLGVDFSGGRSYQVMLTKDVAPTDAKVALADDFGGAGVEVKTFGNAQTLKVTTSYMVDDESDEADQKVQAALVKGLEALTGDKFVAADREPAAGEFTIPSTAKVGATIADDIAKSARTAVLFSLGAIFLYIWMRFRRWRFGLGAVVALFHDTLIVFAVFGIARAVGISFEIDQVFVAAMLTIIGYSINDTVVVFDRIREYLGVKQEGEALETTLDNSISSTLNRTVITSLTTLLVVVILFLMGGEVLRGFSFALLVGILFGTYSSIFIATPVIYDATMLGGGNADDLAAAPIVVATEGTDEAQA
jgi:SecD/SecF fusion protein